MKMIYENSKGIECEVQEAYLDGYKIADILEGVLFRITINADTIWCEGVSELSKAYMNDFVEEQRNYWYKLAIEHVEWAGNLETLDGKEVWIQE
jgi:hypothetical protein